ncbi:hypothetical protein BpHYR1_024296 [Brachionus plicatilis]|uniref:Uncharacterized protein n=1 Tax=Brachionus plicatilis TaxID=10195 RepID=A0A3M7SDV4_BRAPC|nr:hypothetical protein BpHYR1_024296 [Brachionus plicatilis]
MKTRKFQTSLKILSALPCLPNYCSMPETPNIDRLKELLQKFSHDNPEEVDATTLHRDNTHKLCQWSEKSIMSIGLVLFREHPESMKAITDNLIKAVKYVKRYGGYGCIVFGSFGIRTLNKFNAILSVIDRKLGEFGIRIAEFISQISEIFCKYCVNDHEFILKIGSFVKNIKDIFKKAFGFFKTDTKTKQNKDIKVKKNAKFKRKLSNLKNVMNSFEKKMDKVKNKENDSRNWSNEDIQVKESQSLMEDKISEKENEIFEEISTIDTIFKYFKTIFTFWTPLLINEEEILNTILSYFDEANKIINKFCNLHPLYKILCGNNYLTEFKFKSPNYFIIKFIKAFIDL